MGDVCVRSVDQLKQIINHFCSDPDKLELIVHFHKDVERIEAECMAELIGGW